MKLCATLHFKMLIANHSNRYALNSEARSDMKIKKLVCVKWHAIALITASTPSRIGTEYCA